MHKTVSRLLFKALHCGIALPRKLPHSRNLSLNLAGSLVVERMPFTVTYERQTEHFDFPATISTSDIKETVAAAFGIPVDSFGIRRTDTQASTSFEAALEGDFELTINACECAGLLFVALDQAACIASLAYSFCICCLCYFTRLFLFTSDAQGCAGKGGGDGGRGSTSSPAGKALGGVDPLGSAFYPSPCVLSL